ncbi:hypothetical protein SKAU_G00086320 [Synaphobranchus kaupii]|uniref:Uncharacterized protein n=1 Tax=Synaphobranchus kaupii TaxID=118154 RepID=A0A9Q1FVH4_SYNKA|nr:hypothetical protein SKAU_G00086320 [Synaphobranchus kaupii]
MRPVRATLFLRLEPRAGLNDVQEEGDEEAAAKRGIRGGRSGSRRSSIAATAVESGDGGSPRRRRACRLRVTRDRRRFGATERAAQTPVPARQKHSERSRWNTPSPALTLPETHPSFCGTLRLFFYSLSGAGEVLKEVAGEGWR